jgi:hypothetical protein
VSNTIGVIGKIKQISFIEEIQNLKTEHSSNQLKITFDYPQGTQNILVVYRNDRFAKSFDEKDNNKKLFSIEEYNKKGYLAIDIVPSEKYYFTIYVYDEVSNIVSNGVEFFENFGKQVVVKYNVEKKKKFLFFGETSDMYIKLKLDKNTDFILNNIIVVFKDLSVPLNKDDGLTIRTMKKVTFSDGVGRIPIPTKYFNKKGYVKLFFKNQSDYKNARLLPDREDRIKL